MAAGGAGAAAAAVAVEEEGRRTGKGKKARDGGERTHAAGPPAWAPRWAVDMHPAWQAVASVGLYFFHMVGVGCGCGSGLFLLTFGLAGCVCAVLRAAARGVFGMSAAELVYRYLMSE